MTPKLSIRSGHDWRCSPNRTWKRSLSLLWWTLFIVACDNSAERIDAASPVENPDAEVVQRITEAVTNNRVEPACGSPVTSSNPSLALTLSAKQCLSCANAAYTLRRLVSQRGIAEGSLWLVVPPADTSAVCQYLRAEKLRLPVVTSEGLEAVSAAIEHRFVLVRLVLPNERTEVWSAANLEALALSGEAAALPVP